MFDILILECSLLIIIEKIRLISASNKIDGSIASHLSSLLIYTYYYYMVIAKTASRNMVYKANKLGESMFARQSEMLMPEEELGSQSPVSYEEDFEDLSSNADLYVFNNQIAP